MGYPAEAIALLLCLAFFSIISYKKKALNFEGILIANIAGIAIFLLAKQNLAFFLVAVAFFVAGEAATAYGRKRSPKHEVRTTGNILGNSGGAILALAFGSSLGFFAAFASALADTLSSEIGMLSKKKPVLITTLQRVPTGTDGGITRLGMLAALLGAAIIAGIYFFLERNLFLFGVLAISGVFGSLVDSFFGAAFERHHLLNNAEVNFLGSLGGIAMALLLSGIA